MYFIVFRQFYVFARLFPVLEMFTNVLQDRLLKNSEEFPSKIGLTSHKMTQTSWVIIILVSFSQHSIISSAYLYVGIESTQCGSKRIVFEGHFTNGSSWWSLWWRRFISSGCRSFLIRGASILILGASWLDFHFGMGQLPMIAPLNSGGGIVTYNTVSELCLPIIMNNGFQHHANGQTEIYVNFLKIVNLCIVYCVCHWTSYLFCQWFMNISVYQHCQKILLDRPVLLFAL